MRHFNPDDIHQNGGNILLNANAIPSVFTREVQNSTDAANPDHDICDNQAKCFQCSSYEAKIAELTKHIKKITAQHTFKTQTLERKFLSLQRFCKKKSMKLIDTKKLLSGKKNENLQLKEVISTLENERYITSDDANVLNVRNFHVDILNSLNSKLNY